MSRMTLARSFFFPRITRAFIVRVLCVTACAYIGFRFVFRPMWIRGESMEPTYSNGTFTFCFCLRYLVDEPQVGDVVAIRMAGTHVMLLKRILAKEGDTVAFNNGTLHVNGVPRNEPYVRHRNTWNTEPVKVKPGYVFVAGDNRRMPPERHLFGQAARERIVGVPLW